MYRISFLIFMFIPKHGNAHAKDFENPVLGRDGWRGNGERGEMWCGVFLVTLVSSEH